MALTPEVAIQPPVGSADVRLDKISLSCAAEIVYAKEGMLKDGTSIMLTQQVRKGGSLQEK